AIDLTSAGTSVTLTEVPALLLSTSSTAPTLPSGYAYRALLGAVRNDGSSNFISFFQYQSRVGIAAANVFTGQAGVPSWTSQSLSSIVPPTARIARGFGGASAAVARGFAVAADGNGLGEQICAHAGLATNNFENYAGVAGSFSVLMATAQTI